MNRFYSFSLFFIFGLVYSHEFFKFDLSVYEWISSFAIVWILLASLLICQGFLRTISILFLISGHLIYFIYEPGFAAWYDCMSKSIGIPLLFVAIPMIGFPLKHGGYLKSIESLLAAKRDQPGLLFLLLVVLHLAMTIVINIGSIPTMQKLLSGVGLPKKYLSLLYTTGYSSYMVFSPYDPVVNMVLIFSGITYAAYFPAALLMVVVILIVGLLLLKSDPTLREELTVCYDGLPDRQESPWKIYELFGHISVMITLAFISEHLMPLSSPLYGIALIIIVYSLIWGAMTKTLGKYHQEMKSYGANLLPFKGILPFLISATFIGSIFAYTPVNGLIEGVFNSLDFLPQVAVIEIFLLTTTILALCGVHMLVTITAFSSTISPEILGLVEPCYALLLLSCWFIAMSISPLVPFSAVVGDTIGEKATKVTFCHNRSYFIVMILLTPFVICFINWLLG